MSTIFIGDTIADVICFHAIGESNPKRESGGDGNPRRPVDPKIEVVTNRNANPKIMKRMMNCVREIFIAPSYSFSLKRKSLIALGFSLSETRSYILPSNNFTRSRTGVPAAPLARNSPSILVMRGAMSRCTHGYPTANCLRNAAAVIAPP